VDLAKIEVILKIPIPKTHKEVCSFMGHAGYDRWFIGKISKIPSPSFSLLMKDANSVWIENARKPL